MAWQPDYATDEELSQFLTGQVDTFDASAFGLAVTAASRAVDRDTNRQFGLEDEPVERFYTARYDPRRRRYVVEIDDLMDTTGLVVTRVGGTTGAVDVIDLKPANAAADGRPWTFFVVDPQSTELPSCDEDGVSVVAPFGWTTTPTTVKEATLLQASRLITRRVAPFGVAGSPESGSEMRLLAKVDPDVSVTLGPYRRQWGAA
jgi:hypothetical protein